MNELYSASYDAIASESMYSTPSQSIISHENSSASFSQPGEFINFKGAQVCGSRSADLQEYFYIDSAFNFRWRKGQ